MKVIVEYIWLGGQGELRSKTKVMRVADLSDKDELKIEQVPVWNYDGSSCYQASTENSEILVKPQRLFRDPFRRDISACPSDYNGEEKDGSVKSHKVPSYLALCDTYHPNGVPHVSNTRYRASLVFEQGKDFEPLYGLEQEFFMIDAATQRPLGFPKELISYPEPQGKYYCGIGTGKIYQRHVMEEAFSNCIYAGISLTGMNYEVAPGQCELQVCDYGIAAADHLVVCRYILERTFEAYGLTLNIAPKPIKGDWNGSGCHTNFSTKEMRAPGGIKKIMEAVEKLSKKHKEHITIYGQGNHERLTGKHETSSMETFSYGVGNRGCSVRIPEETNHNGCGYLEDRRPAASMDPYLVTAKVLETTCL